MKRSEPETIVVDGVRSSAAALLLFCLVAACAEDGNDEFVRFRIDGIDYAVEQPVFRAIRVRDDHFLMELTQKPASSIPGATVQWQMELGSLESLSGRDLDLRSVNVSEMGPMSLFTLTGDLAAHGQEHSSMSMRIDRIDDGIVEGEFTGRGFLRLSMTEEGSNEVDVSARFRAALEFQP